MPAHELAIVALAGVPLVEPGDDLSSLIIESSKANRFDPQLGDVLVVAQKIVSKAEDCYVSLAEVIPSDSATVLAVEVDKDPRVMEVLLAQSRTLLRKRPGVVIAEHHTGHVLANAGIDTSNILQDQNGRVLCWPNDPDLSAKRLSQKLSEYFSVPVPVIINDSIGRAWRLGTIGQAIGCYGLDPLWCQIGELDLMGNELLVTEAATADAIAAAASLLQGEAAEGRPIVWLRGCPHKVTNVRPATALLRDRSLDMFR